MNFITKLLIVSYSCLLPAFVAAQQPSPPTKQAPQRDPQGLALLAEVLAAAGGVQAFESIRDFQATGTITYFERDNQIVGSVTLRGGAAGQFRLDANLPNGTRSWAIKDGRHGSSKESGGTVEAIAIHNAVNVGSLTLPFLDILSALRDTTISVSSMGQAEIDGRQVDRIRLQKHFDVRLDPRGDLSRVTYKDFLIDPATHLIVCTSNMVHPPRNMNQDFPHMICFSDHRLTAGLRIPFSITENLLGNETWTVQLDSISFNNKLSDSDYQF